MSKEFIERAFNSDQIQRAVTQEEQLTYFLNSKLQDTRLDPNYIQQWAERKFQTNDSFLNWIRSIFKTENFLSFFKYLRYPLPSAKIIKNEIEPQLKRVFNGEDADFKYDVRGADSSDYMEDLNIKEFNKKVFNKILYKHNSLIVSDLDPSEANKPFRDFVNINRVVSILTTGDIIDRIAFKGAINREGKEIQGYIYIDSNVYSFYNKDFELIEETPHDLGHAPIDFISPFSFDEDTNIVRESTYTYVREELEEYVFLKTLQRMTDPNGAIPIVTMVDTGDDDSQGQNGSELQPDADHIMGSQQSEVFSQNEGQGSGDLQTGTVHYINPEDIRNIAGDLNMDVVNNWMTFHRQPVESLEYLSKRISEIERSIKSTIIGDVVESNEESKNQLQIEKSISVLENNLSSIAEALNRIRKKSDSDMLMLKYGRDRVNEVFIHYGTDWFLESQTQLFEDLEKAPNALERKNIIKRINQNRYKNNVDQMSRQMILYDLLPYCSDIDFKVARETNTIGTINMQYQLRFNYWISRFESDFGDIVSFWKELEGEKAQKFLLVNNLIIDIITKETKDEMLPLENIEG